LWGRARKDGRGFLGEKINSGRGVGGGKEKWGKKSTKEKTKMLLTGPRHQEEFKRAGGGGDRPLRTEVSLQTNGWEGESRPGKTLKIRCAKPWCSVRGSRGQPSQKEKSPKGTETYPNPQPPSGKQENPKLLCKYESATLGKRPESSKT